MARPAIVTPAALERVAKMVEQGVRAAEIANEIGCTLGTLRVRCSQSRISLRHARFTKREGDRADYPDHCAAESASYHTGRRLSLWLPQAALIQLDEWAAMHGISTTSLGTKLLVAIARDSLVAAVLDESVSEESTPTLRRSRAISSRS
jgi:hypothetical protein